MNISIPLNSYVNTSDDYIIKDLDTQDKDVLQLKNTLKYKSMLSPMYKKGEAKYYTTSGNILHIDNNSIVDDSGISYGSKGTVVFEINLDLTSLHTGECVDAILWYDNIIALYKNNLSITAVLFDTEGNELDEIVITSLSSSYRDLNIKLTGVITESELQFVVTYKEKTSNATVIVVNNLLVDGDSISLDTNPITTTVSDYIGNDLTVYENSNDVYFGLDDTDLRKRRVYHFSNTISDNEITAATPSVYCYGFGTVGQNGLITGEPIPYEAFSSKIENLSRTTVLSNGVIAYDRAANTSLTVASQITDNAVFSSASTFTTNTADATTWNSHSHSFVTTTLIVGFDLISGKYLYVRDNLFSSSQPEGLTSSDISSGTKPPIYNKVNYLPSPGDTSAMFYQTDFSDGLGNLTWTSGSTASIENGCNPFPYRFHISNRASSRGVYWDYGPGWARTYVRKFYLDVANNKRSLAQPYPTAILSYGLSYLSSSGGNEARIEYLDTFAISTDSFTYTPASSANYADKFRLNSSRYERFHYFYTGIMTDGIIPVDFVGADNLTDHSVLHALPFSVQIDDDLELLEQYYSGNYLSTSSFKALLNSASVGKNNPVHVFRVNSVVSLFINGLLTSVSNSGDLELSKISDYIYKVNTSGQNLLKEVEKEISSEYGFISYNGEEIIYLYDLTDFSNPLDGTDTDGNDVYYTAAGYNVQMNDMSSLATSYLLPAANFQLTVNSDEVEDFTFQLISNKKELTKPVLYPYFDYNYDVVDHYYNHSLNSTDVVYQASKKLQAVNNDDNERIFGISTYDSDKEGMSWWITSDIQIFPLGIVSPITGINYTTASVDMTDSYTVRLYRTNNVTFPVYNPNTEVYKGSTIFTIYGYNYSFDGQGIYYLGSGDDTTQNNFACYALGMKFLANSGTEAYFYSSFEKRIYLFTGSNTLQIADSLARLGDVIDSVYSSHEQILYLLTSDGFIIAKSQEDMAIIDKVDTSYHLESTDSGFVLIDGWNYLKYRLYQTDETEWLPIEYETEYLGKNNNKVQVHYIDVSFYSTEPISGKLYYESVDDISVEKAYQPFDFTKKDFNKSKIQKVRLTPQTPTCKAFKFGIESDDYVHIADVCISIDVVSENTNAAKHK